MSKETFYKVIEGLNIYSVKQGESLRWYVAARTKQEVLGLGENRLGSPIPETDVELVSSCTIIHGESNDHNKAIAFRDELELLLSKD